MAVADRRQGMRLAIRLLFVLASANALVIPFSCRSVVSASRGQRKSYYTSMKANDDDEEKQEDDPYDRFIGSPGLQDSGPRMLRRGSRQVPLDQQPFNELQNLKEAPLFGWAQLDLKGLVFRLLGVYGMGLFISYPIAKVTFPADAQVLESWLAANVGALALVTVLVLRLWVGWSYVKGRLEAEAVEYEETSWYDGATWVKPPAVRARDEMLSAYEVRPVLERMQKALGSLAGAFAVTVIAFKLVVPGDPYEQFSTGYLDGLQGDDFKARTAASKSQGKPTYCGARFYRALSGGSGCD